MDSKLFTLHTIETFWNKIKNKFYVKSADGIPKSDLDIAVQSSLDKADSALQEHQDISGKQDKSTAVTHSANTAIGSTTKPVYIAANGAATPISHSINADVPANAKFTDTTYGDATQSAHGLMTAADKEKLDSMDLTKYLPKDGTAKKAEAMSNGTLRSGFYVNYSSNATSGYTWFRMATCKISGAYEAVNTTFLITNGMVGHALLSCGIRNDGTGKAVESCNLNFSARNGSTAMPSSMFRVVAINSSTGVTYELWGQISARWYGVRYTVLDERNISGGKYNIWTLESHSDADAKTAPTTGNYYVNSSDVSVCATAAKATEATTLIDSGWVDLPLTDTNGTVYPSTSSSVKIRKYGKLVYLQATTEYSSAFSKSHYIAKIPKKYRPTTQDIHLYVPGMAQPSKTIFFFGTLTIVDEDYILEFTPADSGSSTTFNPAMSYTVHMTYFID